MLNIRELPGQSRLDGHGVGGECVGTGTGGGDVSVQGEETGIEDGNVVDVAGLVFPPGSLTMADEVASRYDGRENATTAFKEDLSELCVQVLCPVGEEMQRLLRDEEHLLQVLGEGERMARGVAAETLDDVRDRLGLAPVASIPGRLGR